MEAEEEIARPHPPPMIEWLRAKPLRIVLATLVLSAAVIGLLQLEPGCRHWRAWKASKEGQRFQTLELVVPGEHCVGWRLP